MTKRILKTAGQMAVGFVGATILGSLLFAQTPAPKAPRGEPIRPLAPRGEPIRPLVPGEKAGEKPGEQAGEKQAETGVDPGVGGLLQLGFEKLAGFNYTVPEYTGATPPPAPDTNQIPVEIKAFDGRKVAIKGFMLPLKVKEGKVTELLLMRDQSMCCFGTVPKINEFLTVKMVGDGTKPVMDQAVTLVGRLKVGEFSENGYLLGIYQLDCERAEGPGL
jgi:hypothetical protein